MRDRKEQLEQAGPIRVEVGPDESYGIGWKSATRPEGDILVSETTPRSELTMEIELGEAVKDGVQHKRLWVRVSCDGAIGERHDDQPLTAFRDDEHSIRWVQDVMRYLNSYLPDRLRMMAFAHSSRGDSKVVRGAGYRHDGLRRVGRNTWSAGNGENQGNPRNTQRTSEAF
jgi:hypothetical protein